MKHVHLEPEAAAVRDPALGGVAAAKAPTDRSGQTATLDAYHYPVTCAEPAALEPWRRAARAFLAHAADLPARLGETLDKDPDFALAHLCKGYFLLLLGRKELVAEAQAAYARIAPRRAALTDRERAYLDGLGHYLDGRLGAAADRLDAALAASPRDAVMIKLVHALRFVIGDAAGMRRSLEAVLPAIDGGHAGRAFIRGCYAFALEETGDYERAERIGREAVAMVEAPASGAVGYGDAWGLHAVAHVFDMTNRVDDGVTWIEGQPEAWSHCNNFGYHVWWHLALFYLDRRDYAAALRLYDNKIRHEATDDYRDISNGASLLSRLELDGVGVGDRWEELAALSENRIEDGCVVFADLHYQLALAATGRRAAEGRLVRRLRAASQAQVTDMDQVAARAGAPAAEGLSAFALGEYARAYTLLATARPEMASIGGSWAQRDVFERITIDAALRAGLLDEAETCIRSRTKRRGAEDSYAEARLTKISALRAAGAEAR